MATTHPTRTGQIVDHAAEHYDVTPADFADDIDVRTYFTIANMRQMYGDDGTQGEWPRTSFYGPTFDSLADELDTIADAFIDWRNDA